MDKMRYVRAFHTDEGLVILTPENVRAMSDAQLEQFIEWSADTDRELTELRNSGNWWHQLFKKTANG